MNCQITRLNKNITASHLTYNLSCPSFPLLPFFFPGFLQENCRRGEWFCYFQHQLQSLASRFSSGGKISWNSLKWPFWSYCFCLVDAIPEHDLWQIRPPWQDRAQIWACSLTRYPLAERCLQGLLSDSLTFRSEGACLLCQAFKAPLDLNTLNPTFHVSKPTVTLSTKDRRFWRVLSILSTVLKPTWMVNIASNHGI